jgi:hypothetical protein
MLAAELNVFVFNWKKNEKQNTFRDHGAIEVLMEHFGEIASINNSSSSYSIKSGAVWPAMYSSKNYPSKEYVEIGD